MLRGQEEFVQAVLAAGLATDAEMREYRQSWPPSSRENSAESLAALFVQHHWLTPFQANEILHEQSTPLVLDDYVILDCLGRGGMGEVYKARHRRMERIVALKLIAAHLTQDLGIKRFQREVKAAAKLSHPNIVATYDAGEFLGHHYLVMEYVDGEDLDQYADRCALQPLQAVNLMAQAAAGLEYAHACGVIHRDIKPANLFVDQFGRLRILDMGIARIDHTLSDDALTHTGQLMGTVDYMAPEQGYDIRNIDGRCDIYSLGCTLYRVLTGKLMYHGDTFLEKARRHERDPIPSLRADCPAATAELEAVFNRMVAKRPKDRFPSMTALHLALTTLEQRLSAAPASFDWFGLWGKPKSTKRISTAASAGMVTPPPPTPLPPLPLAPIQSSNSLALLQSAPPGTASSGIGSSGNEPDDAYGTLTPHGNSNGRQGMTEATADQKQAAVTADHESDPTIPQSHELPRRRRSWLGLVASAVCVVGLIAAYVVVSLPQDSLPMLSWRRGAEPADVPATQPIGQPSNPPPVDLVQIAPTPADSPPSSVTDPVEVPPIAPSDSPALPPTRPDESTSPPTPVVTPPKPDESTSPPTPVVTPSKPDEPVPPPAPPIPNPKLIQVRAAAEEAAARVQRIYGEMSPELQALFAKNRQVSSDYSSLPLQLQIAEQASRSSPEVAIAAFLAQELKIRQIEQWIAATRDVLEITAAVKTELANRSEIELFAYPRSLVESALEKLRAGNDVKLARGEASEARLALQTADASNALRQAATQARLKIAANSPEFVRSNTTFAEAVKKMDLADTKMTAGQYVEAKSSYIEVEKQFDTARIEIAAAQSKAAELAKVKPPPKGPPAHFMIPASLRYHFEDPKRLKAFRHMYPAEFARQIPSQHRAEFEKWYQEFTNDSSFMPRAKSPAPAKPAPKSGTIPKSP